MTATMNGLPGGELRGLFPHTFAVVLARYGVNGDPQDAPGKFLLGRECLDVVRRVPLRCMSLCFASPEFEEQLGEVVSHHLEAW